MAYRYENVRMVEGTNSFGANISGPNVINYQQTVFGSDYSGGNVYNAYFTMHNYTNYGFNLGFSTEWASGSTRGSASITPSANYIAPGGAVDIDIEVIAGSSGGEDSPSAFMFETFISPTNSGHPNVIDNAGTWKGYLWRNV